MRRNRFLRRAAVMATSTSTLVAVVLALVLIGSLALRYADKPRVLRIAVSPIDGPDMLFAEALGRELPKGLGSSRVDLIRENSLSAVAAALDDDRAQLAIVRSDIDMPKNAGTMLVVHKDAALFVTLPDAAIKDIAGLEGKRLAIVPGNDANEALLDRVLTHYGIDTKTVTRVRLPSDGVADAVAKKTADAFLIMGPLGSKDVTSAVAVLNEAAGDKSPVFLKIEDAEALSQAPGGLEKIDVPKGMFAGSPPQPEDDFETIGVTYQLVARFDLSEAAVDQLTRTILASRRLLATTAPIAQFMEAPDTEKGSRFPLHIGATSYYQDTEKSFMDRYGDWFYIVAMVAGGAGSAIASLIGSLQARSRRSAMVIIDQLTELRKQATDCTDQAAVRQLDHTVSELALGALHRAREGRFDQAGLEILRLAIDETRRAITRRLAELRSASSNSIASS